MAIPCNILGDTFVSSKVSPFGIAITKGDSHTQFSCRRMSQVAVVGPRTLTYDLGGLFATACQALLSSDNGNLLPWSNGKLMLCHSNLCQPTKGWIVALQVCQSAIAAALFKDDPLHDMP